MRTLLGRMSLCVSQITVIMNERNTNNHIVFTCFQDVTWSLNKRALGVYWTEMTS